MAHNVNGLITKSEPVFATPASTWTVAPLAQGFVLALYSDRTSTPSRKIPASVRETAVEFGKTSPVAFVVTDHWGGAGSQGAAVWAPSAKMPYEIGEGSISKALRLIGVQCGPTDVDEFDAVGFDWFRMNYEWIEFARTGMANGNREPLPEAKAAWNSWKTGGVRA